MERGETLVEIGGNADAKLNSGHQETPKILFNLANSRQYLAKVTIRLIRKSADDTIYGVLVSSISQSTS